MTALDHFLIAQLQATPTGQVRLRALATGMRQGQAVAAARRLRPDEGVLFVASARTRSVTVLLPPRALALQIGGERELATLMEQWLGWLRGHAVVRLATLEPRGEQQWVQPRWLADPRVCACLGIVLTPAPAVAPAPPLPPAEWLAAAPPASIAGLLRDAGLRAELEWWIDFVPAQAQEPLLVPLVHMQETIDGPLHIGWLSRRHRSNPFSLGEVSLLQVSTSGWIEPSLLTLDHGGEPWTRHVDGLNTPPDQAFRHLADPDLDRIFDRLPAIADHLLAVAAYEAKQAGAAVEDVELGRLRLASHLEHLLPPRFASMTSRLVQRAWPVGGAKPTIRRSRYLHAGGVLLLRQRRRELGELAPALALHIADGHCPAAAMAIDLGRPIVAPLAEDWDIPVWAARRTLSLLRQMPSLKNSGVGYPDCLAGYITACGPQAPVLAPQDLPLIRELIQFVPGPSEGPNSLATLRAAGREAAMVGWEGVRALLKNSDQVHAPGMLMAWWDGLRDNVADVLRCDRDSDDRGHILVEVVLANWLQDVSLTECLRLSRMWQAVFWGQDPSVFAGIDLQAPPLFGPFTLLASRIEALPLTGKTLLRDEATEMFNCVASYYVAVATGTILVISLECALTGDRATAAYTLDAQGCWHIREASRRGNAAIPPASHMAAAVRELLALLNDERQLEPTALAFHRRPAHTAPRLFDHAVDGLCLVSRLPPALARVAERCFPGDGPVERRILRAARRVIPHRAQAT